MNLSGGEGHHRKHDRSATDEAIDRVLQTQSRENRRSSKRSESEAGQQESVSLCAVRLANDRKQRQEGTRAVAEGASADENGFHLGRALDVAEALRDGLADPPVRLRHMRGAIPCVQEQDHSEKRGGIQQERPSGSG